MIPKLLFIAFMLFIIPIAILNAQSNDTEVEKKSDKLLKNLEWEFYGNANYYLYKWDTLSPRNAIDLERFVIEPKYRWNKQWEIYAEIEFENGGTGSSVEFDNLEEFGEFEYEIEKGGEVILERLFITYTPNNWFNVRFGRIMLPVSFMYSRHEPQELLTTTGSEMEYTLLPVNWSENGISLFGKFGKQQRWHYNATIINGLDNSAFNSANWIQRGNQKRFEMVNAVNFAGAARLDYHFDRFESNKEDDSKNFVGLSVYYGNSTGNRPKPDFTLPAYVGVYDVHFSGTIHPFTLSGELLYGTLSNSEALSQANRNLSNNLNVKRTPLGASALGGFIELSANVSTLWQNKTQENNLFHTFVRYDYYDSMYSVQGDIFNNPRWERSALTVGIAYYPIEDIILKTQYTSRKLGISNNNKQDAFSLGFAFEF